MASRAAKLAFGVLAIVLLGGGASLGLRTERLSCSRVRGEPAGCTFSISAPLGRVVRFSPGDVSAVEVFERAGSKARSKSSFVVALLDPRGARTEVAHYSERAEADTRRAELEAFFVDSRNPSYVLEVRPGLLNYAFLVVVLGGGALFLMRAWRVSKSELPSAFPARYGAFQEARALTSPAPASARGSRVGAALDAPSGFSLFGVKRWTLLASIALAGATLCAALFFFYEETLGGTLEIVALSRCRFGGMDILPGGSMSMSLEPGPYSIEVYDPSAPGKWQIRHFVVRLGETTAVTCRPAPTARE